MSLEDIQCGLINKLRVAFPDTVIAWENISTTFPAGQVCFDFFFIPVTESVATLGPNGNDVANGMAQVTVFIPKDSGELTSRKTINELRDCFLPGSFQYNGQAYSLLSRSRGGGRTKDNFFSIPFTIRWRAQLSRNIS